MSQPVRAVALACLLFLSDRTSRAQTPPVRRGYTIPLIDLADQKHRQVIVDREKGQYLGFSGMLDRYVKRPLQRFRGCDHREHRVTGRRVETDSIGNNQGGTSFCARNVAERKGDDDHLERAMWP
jgi:hypothetical protein